MKSLVSGAILGASLCAAGLLIPFAAASATPDRLSAADLKAVYAAAGLTERHGQVLDACDQPTEPQVDVVDLNGDGNPEVFVSVGGLCYGNTGVNLSLLIRDKQGQWHDNFGFPGIYKVLGTRHLGYPDIEIGGPGFCFPVWRWNGSRYRIFKRCKR